MKTAPVGLAIGSHLWNVSGNDRVMTDLLAERYRLTPTEPHVNPHVVAHITYEPRDGQVELSDQLIVQPTENGWRFTTDPITIHFETAAQPQRARIVVTDAAMDTELLSFHLWLLVNRLLLTINRLVMHAASVEIDGQTVVICGQSGAGKSTLTVALGLAGATVLTEDWLLVDTSSSTPTVSGISSVMRLTMDSAERMLAGRLGHAVDSRDGRDKRVFDSGSLFASAAGVDHTPDRLFLLSPGQRTELVAASALDVTRYLADSAKATLRFTDRADFGSFLSVVGAFVSSVPAYHLRRSDDFGDLPQLVDLVRTLGETL